MRLDVYTPGTQSGAETNDVKRSGTVRQQQGSHARGPHEAPGGAWLQERPQVSHMGQLMRELHGIKTDDPEAFARITATIAHELHGLAAMEPTDSPERLVAMAERFERASLQGDLSAFRPNPQPYGQVLRGPWAYRQSNDLQEVSADVQAVIGQVLDDYASTRSPNSPSEPRTPLSDTEAQQGGAESEKVALDSRA